ncbi:hypothetical protein [Brevibacterium aurantiacum]|uniref:Uncharacterized protein n=1 Tax=Brevibacterium aurantiacum TaxID=273384 RepID=A0A2H1IJW9_BREAU|nr:hypothetical protein [Brevibacterium aurantiacum]MDN5586831.1 hypothetical protein [Brevibacterium sp.]MDN5605813.1 hypothetical protein [Kocuria sp.]SMX75461.1 hypothetical protein BAURA63_01298 [Brevibacterium aurantiacum]
MWTDWIPAGVAVAIITGVISLYGVRQSRKTATETNKINQSDSLMKNLADEIKRQDERLDKLDQKVQEQGHKIKHLEQREWSLRRYIYRLIDWGKSLGGEPPEPPPGIEI